MLQEGSPSIPLKNTKNKKTPQKTHYSQVIWDNIHWKRQHFGDRIVCVKKTELQQWQDSPGRMSESAVSGEILLWIKGKCERMVQGEGTEKKPPRM